MKNNLFAKPNLKLFLMGALLLVAAKELVIPADSHTLPPSLPSSLLQGRAPSTAEMNELMDRALHTPSPKNFMILSEALRKRGDYKDAMHFLRKARLASDIESGT